MSVKTYGEALEIWKRNKLILPQMPLDDCIFPNANRLLEIEQLNANLVDVCKSLLFNGSLMNSPMDETWRGLQTLARQAIASTERED